MDAPLLHDKRTTGAQVIVNPGGILARVADPPRLAATLDRQMAPTKWCRAGGVFVIVRPWAWSALAAILTMWPDAEVVQVESLHDRGGGRVAA